MVDAEAIFRMGITLVILLAVPAGLLWLLRRLGWRLPGQPLGEGRLRVVARTAVDQKHTLLLVRRDAQEQLLLLGPNGPTILEAAIRPTRADRAEQKRLADEEAARRAATEAAIAETNRRLGDSLRFAAARLRQATILVAQLLGRGQRALQPSFARLVEKHRSRRDARPVAPPRKAPGRGPKRANARHRSA